MDERLPVAEWPRTVDIDVSVSDDIVERGRMYSTLSANPTRALDGGRRGEDSKSSEKLPASRKEGCDIDLLTEWPKINWLPSNGVTGALSARWTFGCMIEDRS